MIHGPRLMARLPLFHGQRIPIPCGSNVDRGQSPYVIFLFLVDLFSSKIDNGPWSEPSLAIARFRSNSYQLNKNELLFLKKGPLKPKKAF